MNTVKGKISLSEQSERPHLQKKVINSEKCNFTYNLGIEPHEANAEQVRGKADRKSATVSGGDLKEKTGSFRLKAVNSPSFALNKVKGKISLSEQSERPHLH